MTGRAGRDFAYPLPSSSPLHYFSQKSADDRALAGIVLDIADSAAIMMVGRLIEAKRKGARDGYQVLRR